MFQKGKSGNPGGKPKDIYGIKELAQRNSPEAMKTLLRLMASEDERVALAASVAVLERGYGKPSQTIEQTVDVTHYVAELPAQPKEALVWQQQHSPALQ